MKKNKLKALIKEAFLAEGKNALLNENAPGFDNRKQGEPLPTLEGIKAAYQAKKLREAGVEEITTVTKMTQPAEAAEIAKAEGTPKTTVDAAIKKAKTSGKDVSIAEDTLEEDRFVDASLEDLEQVVRNLAHTAGMGIEEAAEMAMMHIEDMFMGGEELEEAIPTVLDDKSMDDLLNIILKYVKDPADAEKELERFDAGGFEAISDSVQANLDRDEEYKAWYNKLHSIEEDLPDEGIKITSDGASLIKLLGKQTSILQKLKLINNRKELEDVLDYILTQVNPNLSLDQANVKAAAMSSIKKASATNKSVITEADMIIESFRK
jgi:hypothetical protein